MKTLNHITDYQKYFRTDLNQLLESEQNKIDYIEQSHFGDYLIEVVKLPNDEILKLWRNLDENVDLGSSKIEVTIFCKENNYTFTTLFNQY